MKTINKKHNSLSKKRLEFLENMIKYYSEDVNRRSLDNQAQCCYLTEDGKKCAIGRFIPKTRYTKMIEGNTIDDNFVFDLLPKKIQILGKDFLNKIQILHDAEWNWNENGLTKEGLNKVKAIKKFINEK